MRYQLFKRNYTSVAVDLLVLKRVVNETPLEVDRLIRKHIFGKFLEKKQQEKTPVESRAELKALLLLVAISLMNVEKADHSETIELLPFFERIADECKGKGKGKYDMTFFGPAMHCLGQLLFGMAQHTVSGT